MNKFKNSKAVQRIKQEWDANPLLVITIAAGALVSVSKVIDSISGIQSKRAYARRMSKR